MLKLQAGLYTYKVSGFISISCEESISLAQLTFEDFSSEVVTSISFIPFLETIKS